MTLETTTAQVMFLIILNGKQRNASQDFLWSRSSRNKAQRHILTLLFTKDWINVTNGVQCIIVLCRNWRDALHYPHALIVDHMSVARWAWYDARPPTSLSTWLLACCCCSSRDAEHTTIRDPSTHHYCYHFVHASPNLILDIRILYANTFTTCAWVLAFQQFNLLGKK